MERTPQEINAEIISKLDIAAEYAALGVQLSGQPRESGMVSCYALGRDDKRPSAWVNVKTGYYGDSGGKNTESCTYSLWDFAASVAGKFADWKEARKAYAEKVGVKLGRCKASDGDKWRLRLEFQPWELPGNDILLARWCAKVKPGITPEAVKAAGGKLAYYPCWIDRDTKEKKRGPKQVIALPCYGQWGIAADPVAWVIFDVSGQQFDVTPKDAAPGEPRNMAKMLSIGPTTGATMGLAGLMALSDSEQHKKIEWAWKTAGPTDMLQFMSSRPPEFAERHVAVCNAGGETSDVPAYQAALFAGLKVAVVGDRDMAGTVGCEKWCRALDGICAETRAPALPYPLVESHGKDLRDFLIEREQPFAELMALLDETQAWKPPADAGNAKNANATQNPGTSPDAATTPPVADKDIDLFEDRRIARMLGIDVLGCMETGEIKVYTEHLARTVKLKKVSQLKYADLLQAFGTPVRKCVLRSGQDDVPGMVSVSAAQEAIAHLASERLIGEETELGPGVWPAVEDRQADEGLVLVNTGEAMYYPGPGGQVERITHPRFRNQLLSFESSTHSWYQFDELTELLQKANDPQWRMCIVDDLCNEFNRWRWRCKYEVMAIVGLIMASWVQTAWSWRPRIDVLGGSNTGKSILCSTLSGIFHNCCIKTSDTTAAGLRQEICNSAVVVVVDEIDAKNHRKMEQQRAILEMLRSASRGTTVLRGTGGGQQGVKFTLRHLVWVAGISIRNEDAADKNRSITLNLEPPAKDMQGKLVLSQPDVLQDYGKRSLACALWAIPKAAKLAIELKNRRIDGVDPRLVESYAVPAAMLAVVMGYDESGAEQFLRQMLDEAAVEGEVESDETSLITEILQATVFIDRHRMTVGQVIEYIRANPLGVTADLHRQSLEGAGIKITGSEIVFRYQATKKLLNNTRWEGQPIDQYLRRIDGHKRATRRVGGVSGRVVVFALDWFCEKYIGTESEEDTQDLGF